MHYNFEVSLQFKRDVKIPKHKHRNMASLDDAIDALGNNDVQLLSTRFRDHKLIGDHAGYRELHVEADWLLIYRQSKSTVTILLSRTGTHD